MDFEKWRPWYERILETFSFDRSTDEQSADLMERLVSGKAILPSVVQRIAQNENVVIFGCGPSVDKNLDEYLARKLNGRLVTIAADGATTPLLRRGEIVPTIVVTDLDGEPADLVDASKKGSIMNVHAHGDNQISLTRHVPQFEQVFATTQVEARAHVFNFGGFTDGDRAVFLAEEAGARRIILLGMDFGKVVGKYSKPGHTMDYGANPTKLRKLRLAKELISWLASWARAEILNATGAGETIKGVENVTLSEI